jgi:hypothetical protein
MIRRSPMPDKKPSESINRVPRATEDDDVEGHINRVPRESISRVPRATEDDDVEGHINRVPRSPSRGE